MSTESERVEAEPSETEAPEAIELTSDLGESIRSIVENLTEHAGVRSVYGDPIEADGRTIVPVARVAYGFGGGFGRSGSESGASEAAVTPGEETGQGAGGGGGVSAKPVGFVEVGDGETRFVRFGDRRRAGMAMLAGVVIGLLLGRRRYRS